MRQALSQVLKTPIDVSIRLSPENIPFFNLLFSHDSDIVKTSLFYSSTPSPPLTEIESKTEALMRAFAIFKDSNPDP